MARLLAFLCLLGACAPALAQPAGGAAPPDAQSQPIVVDIRIEGLFRVSPQTVMRQIHQHVGQPLDRAELSEDVRRIMRLGYFADVRVVAKRVEGGVVLVYQVAEKLAVRKVVYEGNDELDDDDLSEVVDLKPNTTVDGARVEANAEKIRDLYAEKCYFMAKVTWSLRKAGPNTADVVFHIDEGVDARVRSVVITGNEHVPDEDFLQFIGTRPRHLLSFLDQSGCYRPEVFATDRQRLLMVLWNHGYIAGRVAPPVLELSPDRRALDVVFHVTEGPQYSVRSVDIGGDLIVPKEELRGRVHLAEGKPYSEMQVRKDIQALERFYQDRGYAWVNVDRRLATPKSSEHEVTVLYTIDKGPKVWFRFVEVEGNERTRDKVIRRELTFAEGDLFSQTALDESRARIYRLGFFDKVEVHTRRTDREDQVDVVITVHERMAGSFQVGAGFSSVDRFLLTAQIARHNLLGRGQDLSLTATLSPVRTQFDLSFFEPWFFDTQLQFGFRVFNYRTDQRGFTQSATGGELTWGYRLTHDVRIHTTYRLMREAATGGTGASGVRPARLFRTGRTSSLSLSLIYDTRDNVLFPTHGVYLLGSAEWASSWLGSENEFVRLRGNTRFFVPVVWKFVYRLNVTAGMIRPLGNEPLPIFQRFLMGGIFDVRGFDRNALGPSIRLALLDDPTSALFEQHIGGSKQFYVNNEIEFPLLDSLNLRGVVFLDFGQAYDDDELIDPTKFRYSAGFGLRWLSPIGPLRFEWGFPLRPHPGERNMVFEFTIGNSF